MPAPYIAARLVEARHLLAHGRHPDGRPLGRVLAARLPGLVADLLAQLTA